MHYRLGRFELDVVSDGIWRIDGGTLFGVVPRAIWEKLVHPDTQNRVPIGLNSLLVRTPEALVLVETGIGTKLAEKDRRHHDFGDGTLVPELSRLGVEPADIDVVIVTHLHFDHAGGNTFRGDDGGVRPTFPNARYVFQKREWEDATHPDGLTGAGYDPDDFAVLETTGQLRLLEGDQEVVPGVVCRCTGGHTPGHQMVLVTSEGLTACYPGDILPTTMHLRPNYITAYDLNQAETYHAKVELLKEACAGRWLLACGHDQNLPLSVLEERDGRVVAIPVREMG